jgi:hypothetical protein
MNKVFSIYWDAWGREQAQLRKQIYIKKTSNKLDKIIRRMYINALSKLVFRYPSLEVRNRDLKSLIPILKDIKLLMKDLDFLSNSCLSDKLPLYEERTANLKHSIYLRSRSRVFRPFVKLIPKHLNMTMDSLIRVDAIVCLY